MLAKENASPSFLHPLNIFIGKAYAELCKPNLQSIELGLCSQVTVCKLSSLSRFQPRAGPDGGDGGRGGSIVLIADNSVKEFAHLPKHIKAENGADGRGDDCKGKNGSDRTFQVNMQKIIHLGHEIKVSSYVFSNATYNVESEV